MTTRGGRLIENFWDCDYCGTKKIGGMIRTCQNCGNTRDSDVVFYKPEGRRFLTEEESKNANRNPDWVCGHCGNYNSDANKECQECGSVRTEKNDDYFDNLEKIKSKKQDERIDEEKQEEMQEEIQEETQEGIQEETQEGMQEEQIVIKQPRKPNYHSNSHEDKMKEDKANKKSFFHSSFFRKYLPIASFAVLIVAILVAIFLPKEIALKVEDVNWERTIEIQKYKTVQEDDWSIPHGGRYLYEREEISHYDKVLDHYETRTREVRKERQVGTKTVVVGERDLGNGLSEEIVRDEPIYETYYETEEYEVPIYREVPVYETRYYYEIDRWKYERSVETSGKDKKPYWGDTQIQNEEKNKPKVGDEKESKRYEHYHIKGQDEKEKSYTVEVSFEDWQKIEKGNEYTIKVKKVGLSELIE